MGSVSTVDITADPQIGNGGGPGEMPTARFEGFVSIADLESSLLSTYIESTGEMASLCLDFSESVFIEITSLQHVIALITDRERRGYKTVIKLPKGEDGFKARGFLRRWNYPAALKKASGKNFADLVFETDLSYFRGKGGDPGDSPFQGVQAIINSPSGPVAITRESFRFFEFTTWDVKAFKEAGRLINDAADHWDVKPVLAVLDKHLKKPVPASGKSTAQSNAGTYVTSRVLFEAMTNALRHPGARVIQSSSHMGPTNKRGFSAFTVVFWDDGFSMRETLWRALQEHREIRRSYPLEFDTSFLFHSVDEHGKRSPPRVVRTSQTPIEKSSDEEFLMAILFPGTTRDIAGTDNVVAASVMQDDPRLGQPGMGLFVLINAAVKIFGGAVSFRCDRFFMNVKPLLWEERHYDAAFRVKIQKYPEALPAFLGNMITVRLPVTRPTSASESEQPPKASES